MSNLPASFSAWLRQTRTQTGLTQEQLAELAGCAVQTVRAIETAVRRPSRDMAERLVEVLDTPQDQRVALLRLARLRPQTAPSTPAPAPSPPPRRDIPLLRGAPAALRPLIGRDAERAALARALGDPSVRLVCLVGPGGAGKTRLALQVAADLAPAYADGALFVALAHAGAADALATVADALGVPLGGSAPLAERLMGALAGRELLLILDSLEHLLGANGFVEWVAALARAAPGVCILATSRERLRLAHEWAVNLGGLGLPMADGRDIELAEASRLFLDCARRATHDFALTTEGRGDLARICRLLDGLPLAIELAAAWVRALSCAEIAAEIARSLDLLSGAGRDADPRHGSIRAVFEHSWRLLAPAEQAALARLAVFQGGFQRPAAETVAGAGLPILARLIDASLLRRETAPRYSLPDLVRQYAAERLAAALDEQAAAHRGHAGYYASLAEGQLGALEQSDLAGAWAALSGDIDNLRAAWAWAVARPDPALLARMGRVFSTVYEGRGWLREGAELFTSAAVALRAHLASGPPADEVRPILGQMLCWQGLFQMRFSPLSGAAAVLAEGVTLLEAYPERLAANGGLGFLGLLKLRHGEYPTARLLLERNQALQERYPDPVISGSNQIYLATLCAATGDEAGLERALAAALSFWRALPPSRGLALALGLAAVSALDRARLPEAEAAARELLGIAVATRDRWGIGMALSCLGRVALGQSDFGEARYLCAEGLELVREVGDRAWALNSALLAAARVALAAGELPEARAICLEAANLALEMEALPNLLVATPLLAAILIQTGDESLACAILDAVAAHPATPHPARQEALELRAGFTTSVRDLPPRTLEELLAEIF